MLWLFQDMQTVNVTIAVNYNVGKDTANKLYKEVGTDYENIIISPAILESIKAITAQYTAEELITKRAEVSAMIQEALHNKVENRGFSITEFNVTNIDFSEAFDQAIEAKAVKQQEVVDANKWDALEESNPVDIMDALMSDLKKDDSNE